MTLLPDAHPSLRELVEDAIAAAAEALAHDGERLDPFLIGAGGDTGRLEMLTAPTPEKALRLGRHTLARASELEVAAVVGDSHLDLDGESSPAVLVEAHRAGEPQGVRVAQRYRRAGDGPAVLVGEPVELGPALPLLPGPGGAPAIEQPGPEHTGLPSGREPRRRLFRRS